MTVPATTYHETAGPWIVEFDSSQSLTSRNEFEEPTESGYSYWMMYLIDEMGHEVAWFSFRSYSYPQKATSDFLDEWLDRAISVFQVTSPTKKSITIDGSQGRLGEGYSSWYSRTWRGIVYPYESYFDSFTNTNMTKHYVSFNSLLDPDDFQEIVDSLHVTNAANM